ncbi:MAG: hypothetical protein IIT65_04840 [Lachnospiraceae bacterium]|nr:hypothetical protein [Lachnospiraceae bacterium]
MGLTKNRIIIGFPVDEKYAKRLDRKTFKAIRVFLTDGQYQEEVFIINEIPTGSHTLFNAKTVQGEEIILNTAWIIKACPVIYDVFRFDVSNLESAKRECKPDNNQIIVKEFACVYSETTEVVIVDEYVSDCKKGNGKVVSRKSYCEDIVNLH